VGTASEERLKREVDARQAFRGWKSAYPNPLEGKHPIRSLQRLRGEGRTPIVAARNFHFRVREKPSLPCAGISHRQSEATL